MLRAGAGSWLIPFLPQPSASSAGVPGVAQPRLRAPPASLPQRRRLGPLWPHPAGRWAPSWPWARGWSWCWGLPWQSSSPCVSAAGGLSLGWRYHRGKIYYFSGEQKPWGDAEAACRSTRSHLTSVTSPEEQDYLAQETRGKSFWIGLAATGPGGSWRWVDGAAYSQAQSFWAPGQPDSTDYGPWGRENCAQIHPVGNGLWNDHNCNFSFPWICKRDLSGP
uniref:C-type lectin domain-containing protein n=1 Tax=Aquila chrysaetos chrysaetos TaxID=223781 RepID=A0A663DJH3_AQUCH